MKAPRYKWLVPLTVVAAPVLVVIQPLLQLFIRWRNPPLYRFYNLEKWCGQALAAGDLSRAAALAQEYLGLAGQFQTDWNYGNAIHNGNQFLGLVSLDGGDVDTAVAYLLKAGKSPGSPQLDTYGPWFVLARELAEAGRTSAVIEYLEGVARFWCVETNPELWDEAGAAARRKDLKANRRLLEGWKRELRAGRVPAGAWWRRYARARPPTGGSSEPGESSRGQP